MPSALCPVGVLWRNTTISNMYAWSFLAMLTIRAAVHSFQGKRKNRNKEVNKLNNKPPYLREKAINISISRYIIYKAVSYL
jgi:hypothetical protein